MIFGVVDVADTLFPRKHIRRLANATQERLQLVVDMSIDADRRLVDPILDFDAVRVVFLQLHELGCGTTEIAG